MIFKQALISILKNKLNIILLWILPIFIIFIPAYIPGGLPFGFNMYGLLNLFIAFFMGKRILEDRQNGTTIRIAVSPIGYLRYLIEHLLAFFVVIMVQVLIFLTAMFIYWPALEVSFMYMLLLYMVYTLMTISMILCWNAMFKTYVMSVSIFGALVSLLALLSGLTLEITWLPQVLQDAALILPTYWLTYGLTAINNSNMLNIMLTYVILIVYSIIFMLVGSKRRFN